MKYKVVITYICFVTLIFITACSPQINKVEQSKSWKVTIYSDNSIKLEYKGVALNNTPMISFSVYPQNRSEDYVKAELPLGKEEEITTQFSAFRHYPKDIPWVVTIEWDNKKETLDLK